MATPRRNSRVTLSVRVRADVADRAREFVRDNAGKPLYLTLASFVEGAVDAHIAALSREIEQPGRRPHTNSRL